MTFEDALEALRRAVSELLDVLEADLAESRFMRWVIRGSDWADRQPVIGPFARWLDRWPKWARFGTREWLEAVGLLYLVIVGLLLLVALLR